MSYNDSSLLSTRNINSRSPRESIKRNRPRSINDSYRSRSRSRSRIQRSNRDRTPPLHVSRSFNLKPDLNDLERLNPKRNNVLAVFGLDKHATENDLYHMYKQYGCNLCKVIFDKRSGNQRGFGFVYFNKIDDAIRAKHDTDGRRILTRNIRVTYSIGEKDYEFDSKRTSYKKSYENNSNQSSSSSSSTSSSNRYNNNSLYNNYSNHYSNRTQRRSTSPIKRDIHLNLSTSKGYRSSTDYEKYSSRFNRSPNSYHNRHQDRPRSRSRLRSRSRSRSIQS